MSRLTQDDSGYFECGAVVTVLMQNRPGALICLTDMSEEVEDTGGKSTLTSLSDPEPRVRKRSASVSSQISRGSSQLWEGLTTPDEEEIRAAEVTERELEAFPSKWRRDDRPKRQRLDPTCIINDDPIVIAHSDGHQRFFDKHKLSWGTQWEIARLVTCGKIKYGDIAVSGLEALSGPNAVAAPIVESCLCPQQRNTQRLQAYEEAFAKELGAKAPWAELDKEEAKLLQDPLSGLGCNHDDDDWYGGKVTFVARLRKKANYQGKMDSKSSPRYAYALELEPPELGASTRFARRWGSRKFLRVRIPDDLVYQRDDQLRRYFHNMFVIHSRVFQPFYSKDHSVFLLEVDYRYTSHGIEPDPDPGKISLHHLLEWHNPMRANNKQTLAKWCARMALGLSNSVPGVVIAPENINEIDDIFSPPGQAEIAAGQKPDSKYCMTDGSGFTNFVTLFRLKNKYHWELVPSAIQLRIDGGKGLCLEHFNDNGSIDEQPRVWIRPSQKKISRVLGVPLDRAHLVIDVLRRSRLKYPARLSTEIIVNLSQNGVPYEVFEELMNHSLQELAASLTQWSGQYAMQHLWSAVATVSGSVIRSRLSRESAGTSRVLGFSSYDKDNAEEAEDEDAMDFMQPRSKAWWTDEISGCPSSLEETVLVLLDAGFKPQSCPMLAAKLKEVFKKALNAYIEKFKIVVPCSAEAWIVPDPCNVLEPGEIFLRTSENIMGQDGIKRDFLLGDVLVTRHPCCVPSDIQKVQAVWKDELRKYYDVIIFSVKGERSLASMLGGGDYDGDTVHTIWESSIVTAFKTADDKFADPPPGLDDAFEKNTTTVEDFLKKHSESDNDPAMIKDRQNYLLASLKDVSLVGQYSNWHDIAVYKFGYEADEAWRLAYMFCAVLDSSKTGKTVRPEVLRQDRLRYNGPGPDWKLSVLDKSSTNHAPPQDEPPRRQGKLVNIKFIMDQLKITARKQYDHHLVEFEKLLKGSRDQFKADNGISTANLYVDPALEAPWFNAVGRAERLSREYGDDRMKRELEMIRIHVEAIREKYRDQLRGPKGSNDRQALSPRKDGSSFTNKPIELRQNILRDLSLDFSHMPKDAEFMTLSPEEIRRCRASYAYVLDTGYRERRSTDDFSKFPFHVAMRELGIIKATSIGPCKMVSSSFYSVFNVAGIIKSFRPADGVAYTF